MKTVRPSHIADTRTHITVTPCVTTGFHDRQQQLVVRETTRFHSLDLALVLPQLRVALETCFHFAEASPFPAVVPGVREHGEQILDDHYMVPALPMPLANLTLRLPLGATNSVLLKIAPQDRCA